MNPLNLIRKKLWHSVHSAVSTASSAPLIGQILSTVQNNQGKEDSTFFNPFLGYDEISLSLSQYLTHSLL